MSKRHRIAAEPDQVTYSDEEPSFERAFAIVCDRFGIPVGERELYRHAGRGFGLICLALGKGSKLEGGGGSETESASPGSVPNEYAEAVWRLKDIANYRKLKGLAFRLANRMDGQRGRTPRGRGRSCTLTHEMVDAADSWRQRGIAVSAIASLMREKFDVAPSTFFAWLAQGRKETDTLRAVLVAAVYAERVVEEAS